MKRLILIFISILILFSITACEYTNFDTSEKIVAPNNSLPPISGKWEIDNYKIVNQNSLTEDEINDIVKNEALFHEKVVVIGKELCLSPTYKLKNVNTLDYLLYQYKINPDFLNIKSKKIQVISMTCEEQYYYEFIKETDDKMIVNIDGVFFHMNKISDDIEDEILDKYLDSGANFTKGENIKNDEVLRSGILLGLKYSDENKSKGELLRYNYRTIWICSIDKKIDKIYETDDLFVPRKTGFWKVGISEVEFEDSIKDLVYAHPLKKNISIFQDNGTLPLEFKGNIVESINYIGNDYVSIESIEQGVKDKRILKVLPLDNIRNDNPIKISDIAGESGKKAFYEGANRYFSTDHKLKNNYVDIKPDEKNFGLVRRNGHWVFKGRINYSEENKDSYGDFNVKTIPPKELVNYDELAVSWNAVKLRVPQALDVFTSPNEDIAVIIAHNNIQIYTIDNGELSIEPIRKINLYPGEKVVMNEWATGKYIYTWEEEFLKNMVSEIE